MSVIQALTKPWFRGSEKKTDQKLGTISGVFVPCILQMIGVILFMRLGWVLGNVGIVTMVSIITLSASIILATALSMTSIVTNMKMGGGGSYFLISRSLGMEFGSAIGILLTVSQIVSIALNVSGFSFSLHREFLSFVPLEVIEICVMCVLTAVSYVSANFAIKTQFFILAFIVIALTSIFGGGVDAGLGSAAAAPMTLLTGAMGFAMFFPAMVGIEAGMSLSGDLKNPQRSLPVGTIAAVFTGFTLYMTMAFFEWTHIPRELLIEDPLVLTRAAKIGFAVVLGIWGATLSSGLGSMLGAPRTIQALSKDHILPSFLSRGKNGETQPRLATLVASAIALIVTLFTDINQLIPILTMVSLVTYTLVNFVSFFESLIKNPSWSPSFTTPWYISLFGCVACIISMLIINPIASFVVLALLSVLVVWFSKRKIQGNWEDIRHSVMTVFVRFLTGRLERMAKNARSWRPHILAVIDPEVREQNVSLFAHAIDQSKGMLTFGATIPVKQDKSHTLSQTYHALRAHFDMLKIPCFVHISPFEDQFLGVLGMVKNYGIASIRPNTVLLQHKVGDSCPTHFSTFLLSSYHMGKNVIVLRGDLEGNVGVFSNPEKNKSIDIWCSGGYTKNAEFALVISHMLGQSNLWPKAAVSLKTCVSSTFERETSMQMHTELTEKMRGTVLSSALYDRNEEETIFTQIEHHSHEASLVFIGLRPPFDEETPEMYAEYYWNVVKQTAGFKNVAFVLAGENIKFDRIFE